MRRRLAAVLSALPLTGCEGAQAVLSPAGHSAARIAELWWFMFALGGAVWLIVVALAVYVLYRKGAQVSDGPIAQRTEGDAHRVRWVIAGTAATLVILLMVFTYSLLTGRSIQALATSQPLTIEVIGHQWWWEVRYIDPIPGRRFETANEVRIPVGEPVRVQLRSQDVIHSFWVPNLAGKTDLIPGRTNTMWIRADEAGIYRGQCAQFCGLQHANMALMVVAEPPAEYAAWAERQLQPARTPQAPVEQRGAEVFATTGCVLCHAVRGTPARANLGPDLTHVASRLTLAAGILPNTLGHLGGWIGNPQVIKPGNRMPRVPLEAEEFRALLAYLQSLE